MTFTKRLAPALAAVAALAAAPALAQSQSGAGDQAQSQGQTSQGQTQGGAPQAQAEDFSDEQLKSFAMAMLDVRDIVQEVEPQLAAAQDAEAKAEIRESATQKMVGVVQESGLSVDTYNAIAQTAGQDPELAEKIGGYVTEAQGQGGGQGQSQSE